MQCGFVQTLDILRNATYSNSRHGVQATDPQQTTKSSQECIQAHRLTPKMEDAQMDLGVASPVPTRGLAEKGSRHDAALQATG